VPPVLISAAVEGIVDEAVVRTLVSHAGGQLGTVYGKHGKPALRDKILGYNNAGRYEPWLVLVDLDADADCAPIMRPAWLPKPAQHLCFRIAVRATESWLMADADRLATFLGVARSRIPSNPEEAERPKERMVNLARRSRRLDIRADMVPRESSGRAEGPAYASRLIEFAERQWRPGVAASRSDSLRRAIACVARLVNSVA
jgi:hypothetical protein